jgi:hypothetical protein
MPTPTATPARIAGAGAFARLTAISLGAAGLAACGGMGTDGEVPDVRINEICPSNATVAFDNAGGAADWIELYNFGTTSLSLEGWFVSDHEADLFRYALPAGPEVAAGGVLLLWADDDLEQGPAHLPFKLLAAGEGVFLSTPGATLVDRIAYAGAVTDQSFARFPDGEGAFAWCTKPTPQALNGQACTP